MYFYNNLQIKSSHEKTIPEHPARWKSHNKSKKKFFFIKVLLFKKVHLYAREIR